MNKVSGQKSVIQLSHVCLAKGQKFSKTAITQESQGMGTNPFRLFLVSSSSTNWYIFGSKRCVTLGDLPSSVDRYSKIFNDSDVVQMQVIGYGELKSVLRFSKLYVAFFAQIREYF